MQFIYDFFLGIEPDLGTNPYANGLYYSAKMLIGLILFTSIIGLFQWIKSLFTR